MTATNRLDALPAVFLAALVAAGCGNDASPIRSAQAQAKDPAPGGDPVQLAVTAEKPEVTLGDDIVLHFKLTNAGKSDVQVNVPRLDKRSVSLRVRTADGTVGTVTRIRAELSQRGEFVYEAPEVKTLAPGQSLEENVSTVAITSGAVTITPSYTRQGAPAALVASPIEVKVTPRDAKETRLGVTLETTQGSYTAVLRPDVAYNTVESFATLVKRGFYSGLKLHRIIKGFMAQGGDPQGNGGGGPGYFLPLEANLKLRHTRGVMSMARTNIPDTAGSQFFIMFATRPDLDQGRYTTFAEMKDGEETLKKLEAVKCATVPGDPQASPPIEPVLIQSAKLVTLP